MAICLQLDKWDDNDEMCLQWVSSTSLEMSYYPVTEMSQQIRRNYQQPFSPAIKQDNIVLPGLTEMCVHAITNTFLQPVL